MRSLVTGARGFLGRHLVTALHAAGNVVERFEGDVRDAAAWSTQAPVDVVYHLAAVSNVPASVADPGRTWDVNGTGTIRLLEWARAGNARRVVLASTAHVYGRARYSPIDERHPTLPVSPYGASKLAAEAMGLAYHHSYGLDVIVIRPFNIYGPGQPTGFLIPDVLAPLARGEAPRLGNPVPVRDFTYVDDAASFFIRAGEQDGIGGAVLNLGSGEGHSVEDVARAAVAISGTGLEPIFDVSRSRANETDVLIVDNTFGRSLLSWAPNVTMETGLRRTWQAMREEHSLH